MTHGRMRYEPVQHRARTTRAKIEAAARAVIAREGRDAFTTSQICEEAGVSIGTFYRYFTDRVAILDHLWPNRCEGLDCPRTHADWGRV